MFLQNAYIPNISVLHTINKIEKKIWKMLTVGYEKNYYSKLTNYRGVIDHVEVSWK